HVRLHVLDGAQLIGRLLEAEGGLELALPGRVDGKRGALAHRAAGVELEELLRPLTDGRAHRFLDPLPGTAPQPIEPSRAGGGPPLPPRGDRPAPPGGEAAAPRAPQQRASSPPPP